MTTPSFVSKLATMKCPVIIGVSDVKRPCAILAGADLKNHGLDFFVKSALRVAIPRRQKLVAPNGLFAVTVLGDDALIIDPDHSGRGKELDTGTRPLADPA